MPKVVFWLVVETIHLIGTQLAFALSHHVGCKMSSCGWTKYNTKCFPKIRGSCFSCTSGSHLAVDIGVQSDSVLRSLLVVVHIGCFELRWLVIWDGKSVRYESGSARQIWALPLFCLCHELRSSPWRSFNRVCRGKNGLRLNTSNSPKIRNRTSHYIVFFRF